MRGHVVKGLRSCRKCLPFLTGADDSKGGDHIRLEALRTHAVGSVQATHTLSGPRTGTSGTIARDDSPAQSSTYVKRPTGNLLVSSTKPRASRHCWPCSQGRSGASYIQTSAYNLICSSPQKTLKGFFTAAADGGRRWHCT